MEAESALGTREGAETAPFRDEDGAEGGLRRNSIRSPLSTERRERYSAVSDGVDGFLGRKSETANESSGHEAGVTRELSSRENRTR